MKHKKKISLLLALALGTTPVIYSFEKNRSYAEEIRETKINEIMAKKLGIKVENIEFCNFDLDLLNNYFSPIKQKYVGISSESIETKTYTRSQLKAMLAIQRVFGLWYAASITRDAVRDVVTKAVSDLSEASVKYIATLYGVTPAGLISSAVGYGLGKMLDIIAEDSNTIMKKWIKDGENLIQKALDTGKSRVTLKYMKLTWKTAGNSIITGGAILK